MRFRFLNRFLRRADGFRDKRRRDGVRLAGMNRLVYTYPLIIVCGLLAALGSRIPPALAGAGFLASLTLVIFVTAVDLSVFEFIFVIVSTVAAALAMTLAGRYGLSINPAVDLMLRGFNSFDVRFCRPASIWFTCIVLVSVASSLTDYWIVDGDVVRHIRWGRTSQILERSAVRIITTTPDIVETLLLGAGTMTIFYGPVEIGRIENCPFAIFKERRLLRQLEAALSTDE